MYGTNTISRSQLTSLPLRTSNPQSGQAGFAGVGKDNDDSAGEGLSGIKRNGPSGTNDDQSPGQS